MRNNHQTQSRSRAGLGAARLFQRCNHAVQRAVLTEEKDFVFASEVVVKVRGGKCGGFGNVAHTRFDESSRAEFPPGGAQYLEAPRQIAPVLPPIATLGWMI